MPPFRTLAFAAPFALAAALAAALPPEPHGVQKSNMDTSVRPGDDFNLYANGSWIKSATIPPDQAAWGSFSTLRDKAAKRTADLIEDIARKKSAPGSNEEKIGDYYASFLDEAGIEGKGIAPVKPELDAIEAIADKHALATALGHSVHADVDALNNTNFYTENIFGLWVAPGFDDPDHYSAYLLQGGLGLPDRAYYVDADPETLKLLAAYQTHVAKTFALAGFADADARAAAVVALETRLAEAQGTRADSEDVLKANNYWSRADFDAKAPGLDWGAFFDGAALKGQKQIIVWQPTVLPGISAAVADTPLAVWKDYLAFHLLNHYSAVLPKAFSDEHFAFYGAALSGTPQQQARWKRAVAATNVALGWAVGKLYAERYFPPAFKARAQAMVETIKAAFAARIDALDWMSPATKAKAKDKLTTLYVGIGYPDKWISYAGLDIARGEAFGNLERAERFEYARNVALLGTPVDRSTWCMTPQTVNAVNLPLQNALNFPAAILDPPFFDADADSAFNYGAMGSVIGHEISHSFDDQGSQFDASGRLVNWWTDADFAHFRDSALRLADQYSHYAPFPGVNVNGQQTLSENIADVAGLSASFDAWRASLGGKPAAVIDGLSGEQRFFLAYAQTRQSVTRDAALRQQIMTDGHAPSMYRALAVRNIDGWYDAFGVTPDQRYYLDSAHRVRVW
ncbi:MAG TPA: M13 family metallopeptidase [Rhizomicrobium sp.]|jgi:predicted metalloendopeptidase|nr:M13 family metallopeptidase [Rhizomicrobium sp.]